MLLSWGAIYTDAYEDSLSLPIFGLGQLSRYARDPDWVLFYLSLSYCTFHIQEEIGSFPLALLLGWFRLRRVTWRNIVRDIYWDFRYHKVLEKYVKASMPMGSYTL